MCLATPLKIKKINNNTAIVGDDHHDHQIDLSLLEDTKEGEWVICHGDLALNKIEEKEAKEILKLQICSCGH